MLNIHRNKRAPHLLAYLLPTIAAPLLLLSFSISADHEVFKSNQGVAIYGFDPVAYFTLEKAKEGSKDISVEFLGATWQFVSQENRELFLADPGRYIPQYGGHCAWGTRLSSGHVAPDPVSWKIVDGKLYLFVNHSANARWDIKQPKTQSANRKWEVNKATLLQQ